MLVLVLYGHTVRRLSTITQTKKMHVQTHPVCSSETQANPLPAQQKTEKFNSHFLSKCYSPGSHIWDHRLFQDEHRQDMEIMPIVIFFSPPFPEKCIPTDMKGWAMCIAILTVERRAMRGMARPDAPGLPKGSQLLGTCWAPHHSSQQPA